MVYLASFQSSAAATTTPALLVAVSQSEGLSCFHGTVTHLAVYHLIWRFDGTSPDEILVDDRA